MSYGHKKKNGFPFSLKFFVISFPRRTEPVIAVAALYFSTAPPSGTPHVHKDYVLADFDDTSQINEQITAFFPKTTAPGYDNPQPSVFGITQRHVAHPAKPPPVLRVDDFFRTKLRKTKLHTALLLNGVITVYAENTKEVPKKTQPLYTTKAALSLFVYEMFSRMFCRAFFSKRETCACEMPTSSEISVCVFPS